MDILYVGLVVGFFAVSFIMIRALGRV